MPAVAGRLNSPRCVRFGYPAATGGEDAANTRAALHHRRDAWSAPSSEACAASRGYGGAWIPPLLTGWQPTQCTSQRERPARVRVHNTTTTTGIGDCVQVGRVQHAISTRQAAKYIARMIIMRLMAAAFLRCGCGELTG